VDAGVLLFLQTSLVVKPVVAGKPKFWADAACGAASTPEKTAAAANTLRSIVFIIVLVFTVSLSLCCLVFAFLKATE
jgi:hypothetical protein